ncbi:hypothetical protein D7I40_20060 [Citrobacter sp. MH181794]|nr:hypothetical protein D7I40_20060 [Citrobacter sp. MH181794]
MTLKTLRVRPREHKNVTEEVKKSRAAESTVSGTGGNYAQTPAVLEGTTGISDEIKRINRAFCHPAHDYSTCHPAFYCLILSPI